MAYYVRARHKITNLGTPETSEWTAPLKIDIEDGNMWCTLPNYGFRASGATGIVGDYFYLLGGNNTSHVKTCAKFNLLTNKGTAVPDIPTVNSYCGYATYNNKIYMAGGYNNASYINSFYAFDPVTELTTQLANMPYVVGEPACAVVNNKFYLFGGKYNTGNDYLRKEVAIYDFLTEQGSYITALPYGMRSPSVAADGQYIYITCGYSSTTATSGHFYSNKVYRFNTVDNTFVQLANHPNSIHVHLSGINGDYLYTSGGSTSTSAIDTMYRYTISTNTWVTLPQKYPIAHYNYSTTLQIKNNKVYSYGGYQSGVLCGNFYYGYNI